MTRTLLLPLLLAAPLAAAPPDVTVPDLKPTGRYATWTPPDAVVSAVYIPDCHDAEPFPIELITDDPKARRKFFLDVFGLKPGTYRYRGVFANDKGEQTRKDFVVVVGKGGPVTPPPDAPTDPVGPPQPVSALYFAVIRPDGPADKDLSRLLALPEWDRVRAAGHLVKDFTVSEAAAKGFELPPNLALPALLTYRPNGAASGKPTYDPAPTRTGPVPATGADVLKLLE